MKTKSNNLRDMLTLGTACILTLSGAMAGVYDDAKAVYVGNGGGASGANVRPTTCTWRDVRHAADPTATTHANMTTCGVDPNYVAAYDNTIVYSNADVTSQAAGLTFANEPVLYFNHKFRKDGETRYHTPNILNLGWTFPKNEYTILMRFKPEEPIGMTSIESASDNTGVALFSVQGTWQKSGYHFGYCPNAAGTGGTLKVFGYGAVHSGNASAIRLLTVTNEVWHELAVTVKGNIMKISLARDPDGLGAIKRLSAEKDWSPHVGALDWFTPEQDKTIVIGGSGNTISEKTDMTGYSFRGMIHMMAFWDRVLTQGEINEAFSEGRPSVLRIGFGGAAAGSDQFAGASGSSVTLSSANPWAWREFPASLVKDATVTIPFEISARDAGYGQFLRVFGEATSGRGNLTVGLDGVNLGGLSVGPVSGDLFIPGTALAAGSHMLTVTRNDAGAETVKLGSLSIEGSWVYKMGETSPVTDNHAITPVTDGYIGSVRKSLNQGEVNSQSFAFVLDDQIKAMGKLEFHLKLASSKGLMKSDMRLTLNGNVHSYENVAHNGEIVLKLPVSELKVGENVIKVSCFDTETNWPSFEYYRMEATGLRKGLALIFR